jgi:SAM-dependent methyltransferase
MTRTTAGGVLVRNPHFDDRTVEWSDEYSGRYAPPSEGYSSEFDLQWRLAAERQPGYFENAGASTDDEYIFDRVYEWTGQAPSGVGPSWRPHRDARALDRAIDPTLIRDKYCVDAGCGMGRWTRTLQALGAAKVLSIDLSESGLTNVRKYNAHTLASDVTRLDAEHPELAKRFDFAVCWGVVHHTHDPALAFRNVANLVAPNGALYVMVYAPEGVHATRTIQAQRSRFHRLRTVRQRVDYVNHIYDRRWDRAIPTSVNVMNLVKRALRHPKDTKVGILDTLEPFYNWVIPFDVVNGWFARCDFRDVTLLNARESRKCAFHILGRKR